MAEPLPPASTDSPAPIAASLPPVTLSLAVPADFRSLAILQREAFATDAMMAYVNEHVLPSDFDAHTAKGMEGLPKHRKLVIARRGDQMAGFAVWEFPLEEGEVAPEEKPRTFPPGARTEEIIEFRRQYADECINAQPRFVLAGLAVHPNFRRQGIAQALVGWGIAQVDASGLPAFLQSSTQAISTYEKFGFVPYRPTIRGGPDGMFAALPMRRDPLPIAIAPATEEDMPAFGALQRLAFQDELFDKLVLGEVEPLVLEKWFEQRMGDLLPFRKVFIARRGSTVLGFSAWGPPDRDLFADKVPKLRECPGAKWDLAADSAERISAMEKRITEKHWLLGMMMITPQAQGTGVGKELIQQGLNLADATGLPVYLKSTDIAREFYKRFGFEQWEHSIRGGPEGQLSITPMRRAPSPLMISPATRKDLPSFGRMTRLALWSTDPMQQLVFGGVDAKTMDDYYTRGHAVRLDSQKLFIARRGKLVVGVSAWTTPIDGPRPTRAHVPEPEGSKPELVENFHQAAKKSVVKDKCWYLNVLFSLPEAEGTGVGSALIGWGLAQADRAGLPTYLKSTPVGLPFYQRKGFSQWDETIVGGPNGEAVSYPLKREAAKLVVDPATAEDCAAFGHIQRVAFIESPLNILTFSEVPEDKMEQHFALELADRLPLRRAFTARRGNEVVGFSMWIAPRSPSDPPPAWIPDRFCEGSRPEVLQEFWDSMDLGIEERHWYLEYLVVHPDAQGTGVGSELLKWGLAQADEEGLPVFLKSSVWGKRIYEKNGFEQWHPTIYGGPDNVVSVCPMKRLPRPAA